MASQGMTYTRRQLQIECSRASRRFVQIVQKGCDLLGELKEGVIPEAARDKIFSNRKQEGLAYATYTRAQRRLWRFLTDSEPEDRVDDIPPRKKPSNKRHNRASEQHDRMIG
ncbi:MAG: hypothetical protein ACJ74Z_18240 [Bryobacteraceae bacterium]